MTTPADASVTTIPRDPDLTLARIHLRLGSLALARAELEALAGRDALDDDGLIDLAEVRWRTGDVAGAGDAAAAVMSEDGEGSPAIALIVAAEAAIERGRPTEARRFADLALVRAGDTLDALFAGMPRSGVWPADALVPDLPPPTLFDAPARPAAVASRAAASGETSGSSLGPLGGAATAGADAQTAPPSPVVAAALTLPLWAGEDDPGQAGLATGTMPPDGPDALGLGETALRDGDIEEAAVQLGLALRLTPALAPAVIDLLGDRDDRRLALVLGDAYRLVGREEAARQAFAAAAQPRYPATPPSLAVPRSGDGPDHDPSAPGTAGDPGESDEGDPA